MVFGFTGASRPPENFEVTIDSVLGLPEIHDGARSFITGSQVGVDETVAERALALYPAAAHIQVVPGDPGTYGRLLGETRWILMPKARDRAAAYRTRNEKIVELADVLIALPEGLEELYPRSGTWMTVRIARKAGLRVWVFPLDGSDPWREVSR